MSEAVKSAASQALLKRRISEELQRRQNPSVAADVAKGAGVGVAQGGIDVAGTLGDAQSLGGSLNAWLAGKFGASPEAQDALRNMGMISMSPLGQVTSARAPTSAQIQGNVEKVTGPFYEPQTRLGRLANAATRFATNAAVAPGGTMGNMGRGALAGVTSEAAGQATEGTWAEPIARVAGGIVGGLSPDLMKAGWNRVRMAMRGVDEKAANKILTELANSGMTPDEALQKVQQLGPEGMLADTSPGMQVLTGGTAIADPAAGNTIATRLATRRAGAPARVANALDQNMGQYMDPQSMAEGIKAERATASPAYQALQGQVVDVEPAINLAHQEATRFGYNSPIGKDVKTVLDMLVDETGKPIANGERVHAARIQIDSMIEAAKRRGENTSVLSGLRKEIDKAVKQVPGVAEADKLWAETAKIQQAYDFGQTDLMGKSVFPGQLEANLKRATDPERQAMTQGARAKLAMDFSGNAKNPTVGLERTLQGAMNDQKLPQLIGQDKFNNLANTLNNETTFLETSALGEPARQSRTAVIDAAKNTWGAQGGQPSAIADATGAFATGTAISGGNPVVGGAAATATLANRMGQKLSQALRRKAQPAIIQAAAEMLTSTGGDVNKAVALMNKVADQIRVTPSERRVLLNAVLTVRPAIAQGSQTPAPVGQ